MRLTFFIVLIGLLKVSANAYSQQTRLSMNLDQVTLKDAFREIEDHSNFVFFYNAEQIELDQKVSLRVENVNIEYILDELFRDKTITYKIMDRRIVLYQKEADDYSSVFQQPGTIKGKVTSQTGEPLPGVSVVIKGTSRGTTTDKDGNFVFTEIPGNATLAFSFIGMKSQEFLVGSKTTVDVVMEEDLYGIEEVVAVGYGTMKKQAVTGAVIEANLELYKVVPVNNILETVKGSIAGLNIDGINKAGEVAEINIRGQNSTEAASNSPLIVLDGAIYNGSLGDIPTDDIENFTVLKDASAAAVYGSRSANGVIIVETKKGDGINGKPKFDVKLSYGVSDMLEPLDIYDAGGYIKRLLDIRKIQGVEADPNKVAFYLQTEEAKNYNATPDHKPTLEDPFGLISQLGYNFNTTVSMSNKTDKNSYYISASMVNQRGVVLNDEYKHFSGRVNIDSDLTDWFSVGIKSSYSLRDYSGDAANMYWSVQLSPYASIYNEDGSYREFPQTSTSVISPFWQMATDDVNISNNLNGVITGTITIPWIKGLTFQTIFSNNLQWTERNWFYDENTVEGLAKNGIGQRAFFKTYDMLFDNMLKFNRVFNEIHSVDVTLLYSREHSVWEDLSGYATNFDNTVLGTYKLENGKIQTVDTGGGETFGIGLMARGTYTFNSKYSVTGTIRRDGYSAFSKNKKWGVFPSVGLNWNITREKFMESVAPVDNLALRLSYGTNGNQSLSAYSTLARVGTNKYIFAGDPSYTVTQYIETLANDDLGWESTTGLNTGIDFSLFKKRLNGSVDAYKTKTTDLMFSLALPGISGKSSITSNIGEIQNKGIEMNLHSVNVDKGKFKWSSDFAFSLNRNKVVTILGEDNDGDGKEDDLISSGYFIGRSLEAIYSYKVIGMWQQEDVNTGTIMTGARPGEYKIEDINQDDAITSDEDRQIIGNGKENFRWSFTNTFSYQDFSLMIYFNSIWGGNGWYLSGKNTPYFDGYSGRGDVNHPVYDYWTASNTDAMFPRPDYDEATYKAIKFVDRSFIKLQKVSLTYNLTRLVRPWGINQFSVSLSADNLFTYAPHWKGLDPETDNGLTDNAVPSIRTYLLAFSLNF